MSLWKIFFTDRPIDKYNLLLDSQRRDVERIIENAGFKLSDFEWVEVAYEDGSDLSNIRYFTSKIVYKHYKPTKNFSSGYFFHFNFSDFSDINNCRRVSIFAPGKNNVFERHDKARSDNEEWSSSHLRNVKDWIYYLKREVTE